MSACFIQFLQNTLEGDCFVSIKENPVKLNLHSPTSENSGNFLIHLPFITSSPGFRLYEVTVMTVISLVLWEKSLTPLALPPSQVQSLVRDWVLVCPEEDFKMAASAVRQFSRLFQGKSFVGRVPVVSSVR